LGFAKQSPSFEPYFNFRCVGGLLGFLLGNLSFQFGVGKIWSEPVGVFIFKPSQKNLR